MPKLAELVCELCSTYYYDLAEVPQLTRGDDGLRTQLERRECAFSNRPVPVSCLRAMKWFADKASGSTAGRAMACAVCRRRFRLSHGDRVGAHVRPPQKRWRLRAPETADESRIGRG